MKFISITREIPQPRTWEDGYLMLRRPEFEGDENGSIIHSIELDFSGRIEVYFWRGSFEWRVVDVDVITNKDKVMIDSFEALYGSSKTALIDALLFCKQEDFI